MRTIAIAAAVVMGGCGDPTVVTVHASGATLVAIDVGDGWQARPAGDVTFDEPDGVYRLAVTCRADIGDTAFVLAAPGDPPEHELDCPDSAGVEVGFDVTGDVYGMFIGYEVTYSPDQVVRIAPGTYDVIATQHSPFGGTFRAQVIRDVVIDGPTRIPIDVGRDGVPLEDFDAAITGGFSMHTQLIGVSARGTWFQLSADRPRRLPASVQEPGDAQTLHVRGLLDERPMRPGRSVEVTVPANAGDVAVTVPTLDATVAFTTTPGPAAALSSVAGWDRASLYVAQDNVYGVPGWYLTASAGAIARGAALAFPDPPPGWRPAWTVDTTGYYGWRASVRRDRADGGVERISLSDGVYDPEP